MSENVKWPGPAGLIPVTSGKMQMCTTETI